LFLYGLFALIMSQPDLGVLRIEVCRLTAVSLNPLLLVSSIALLHYLQHDRLLREYVNGGEEKSDQQYVLHLQRFAELQSGTSATGGRPAGQEYEGTFHSKGQLFLGEPVERRRANRSIWHDELTFVSFAVDRHDGIYLLNTLILLTRRQHVDVAGMSILRRALSGLYMYDSYVSISASDSGCLLEHVSARICKAALHAMLARMAQMQVAYLGTTCAEELTLCNRALLYLQRGQVFNSSALNASLRLPPLFFAYAAFSANGSSPVSQSRPLPAPACKLPQSCMLPRSAVELSGRHLTNTPAAGAILAGLRHLTRVHLLRSQLLSQLFVLKRNEITHLSPGVAGPDETTNNSASQMVLLVEAWVELRVSRWFSLMSAHLEKCASMFCAVAAEQPANATYLQSAARLPFWTQWQSLHQIPLWWAVVWASLFPASSGLLATDGLRHISRVVYVLETAWASRVLQLSSSSNTGLSTVADTLMTGDAFESYLTMQLHIGSEFASSTRHDASVRQPNVTLPIGSDGNVSVSQTSKWILECLQLEPDDPAGLKTQPLAVLVQWSELERLAGRTSYASGLVVLIADRAHHHRQGGVSSDESSSAQNHTGATVFAMVAAAASYFRANHPLQAGLLFHKTARHLLASEAAGALVVRNEARVQACLRAAMHSFLVCNNTPCLAAVINVIDTTACQRNLYDTIRLGEAYLICACQGIAWRLQDATDELRAQMAIQALKLFSAAFFQVCDRCGSEQSGNLFGESRTPLGDAAGDLSSDITLGAITYHCESKNNSFDGAVLKGYLLCKLAFCSILLRNWSCCADYATRALDVPGALSDSLRLLAHVYAFQALSMMGRMGDAAFHLSGIRTAKAAPDSNWLPSPARRNASDNQTTTRYTNNAGSAEIDDDDAFQFTVLAGNTRALWHGDDIESWCTRLQYLWKGA
jgi:hypothetical protein